MQFENVTCPHCGILCDDLSVEVSDSSITLLNIDHPQCTKAFEQARLRDGKTPNIHVYGKPASLQQAVDKACEILRNANQPLVSGLICDVQACRESVALAEKLGAVIDHASGSHMRANVAVMQRVGKVKTTLAEARNRADNVIIFGSDVLERFPRLMQRVLLPNKTLGTEGTTNKQITIIDSLAQLGNTASDTISKHSSPNTNINHLKFDAPDLDSIIRTLELTIQSPNHANTADSASSELVALHEKILQSNYTTIIWHTGLFNQKSAELSVQTITQIIKTLMKQVRCVGLPLGGSKGEITAGQVVTWQTGVPLPIAFMSGAPVHDPLLYDGATMIENNEADALVWVSTYSPDDAPPNANIPTIVIGHPGMQLADSTAVFIPVGIPGIDTRGLACRTDSVATLPLHKIRECDLLAASDAINKIFKAL